MKNSKKTILAIICATIIGSGYWYYLVSSYESELGTSNTFVGIDDESSVSNGTNDRLLSIGFDSGEDQLEWAFTSITLSQGEEEYDCTLGGLSSIHQQPGLVQTKLNADGQTFTMLVDATSESSFTKISLSNMTESNASDFSLRFSKTDIFLSDDLSWLLVEDVEFNQLTEVPTGNFSNDTSTRLEWYEYDISTHRVEPLKQIYIIDDGSTIYKIQFVNYYNEADESRHITYLVSRLAGDPIPAISDPNLVQASPCIIIDDDLFWSPSETIEIQENGFSICQSSCQLKIAVTYENTKVTGTESIDLN